MTVKVALYARVSTREQTTDNQLMRLRQVAAARDYVIIGEYLDVASGADPKRPQLAAMLNAAKKGQVDRIIALRLDRLARSVINLAELVGDLDTWGVGLEIIDQPIDTTTPSGRLTYTILAGVAEFERELIRDRTRDGLARAKAQGKTLGRPKRQLSDYQRAKLRQILTDNPTISMRALSARMEGISRTRLAEIIKEGDY
jgi:DNA invertase Pin-like site-specific DNA recombinase